MHDRLLKDQVVVVGCGLAGLSAACVLAARGHRVVVLEKNDWLGGKAAVLEQDGFRFDMGPTILTLPSVLHRVFQEAGKRLEDYLHLVPLDPQWRCFFEDGGLLDLHADIATMQETLKTFTGDSQVAEGYGRFMAMSRRLHDVSERFFFWKSVGGIGDTLDTTGMFSAAVLKDVLSLRMGSSVASVVRSHLADPRTAQMVDHFTQYVGSSPSASPAVLCGIAHMQTQEGIWYPLGGTRAIPDALIKLAQELGVEFRMSCDVAQIRTAGNSVVGVELTSGEAIQAQAVVSNCDAVRTHRELLREHPAPSRLSRKRDIEPACSGVVLYLGLKERYEHLLHHNFVFSQSPDEEFEWIYQRGLPAPDPTCYVCAPAVSEPAVAPDGGEALYVLVHTPYLRPNHDWSQLLPEYREVILDKLERTAGLNGLRQRIVSEHSLTPADIHSRYRVLNGAIYGVASHGKYLGAFKSANRSPELKGLYLAGGAAHPGPGMPMVLMSGWIAADALDQDCQAV
ncbi:phytoene desaturase family protein [Aureliella helgolandensis]|uniref:Diapolycopene oxygenase n=1 Tax=Aureliella helgolandensis TaxID=2527968 RepID=A0A518G5Q3_9BACT|nr:phytoene desaturase family protein [Aureliella helgolandensis]QDV23918.1 Diapolycopene oxygenase [Aureliella helgolandensis]